MFKNHLNFLKDLFSNAFLRSIIILILILIFFTTYNDGKVSLEEENIIKDIRNLFTLKKELNYTTIKDIRNRFRLEKVKAISWRY